MKNFNINITSMPVYVHIFKYFDTDLKWGKNGTMGYLKMSIDDLAINDDIKNFSDQTIMIKNLYLNKKAIEIIEKIFNISSDKFGYQIVVPELN